MGKIDAVETVQRMMAAFRQDLRPEAVVIYAERLADIPIQVLQAAADRLIETHTFFPAISEIRRTAARMCGLLPATPAEAMAMVRRADVRRNVFRRDGSFAYLERSWEWPEGSDDATVALAQSILERVGEPCDADGNDRFGWEIGFQKTYESAFEDATVKALSDLSRAQLPGHVSGLLADQTGCASAQAVR